MKISRLAIADYQQFKWLDLDLTYRKGHPKAGQPLDRVCFIGANGTGKTTLLEILGRRTNNNIYYQAKEHDIHFPQMIQYEFKNAGLVYASLGGNYSLILENAKSNDDLQLKLRGGHYNFSTRKFYTKKKKQDDDKYFKPVVELIDKELAKNRLHIYCPSEYVENELLKNPHLPQTNLSEALELDKSINKKQHIISYDNFKEFWKLLIYHTNKRMSDEVEFLNANENEVVGKLKRKFAATNPDILEVIAELWAKILDPAGLYFDYEKAKRPFQLLDNLEAYIKLKSTDKVIPYNKLSSGIRDMIFRFGYLKALYFGRDIDWATALIDEPENSLFVDLQYNIIELYEEVCPNTQLFFATHSPIIAAQFHPDERVILEFDEEGYVTASRGVAAEGDDPNDVLVGDFKRQTVLGKVGEEKWQRYVELIHLMENETDEKKKVEHAKEFMKIGSDYKFGAVMPN